MKNKNTISLLCALGLMGCVPIVCAQSPAIAAKLPYAKGQSFVVTQGFHSLPTHIKKDDFAIDFTQNGCEAYAKPALAAISGKAWVVTQAGYSGGYGTQLLLLSDGNVVTRYAHLIPGSITVKDGDEVMQGMQIGEIGNSGLVMGTACALHPGTHIHFAMDINEADGSFAAKDPEPISGYTDIQEGRWYVSDNDLSSPASDSIGLTAIVAQQIGTASNSPDFSLRDTSSSDSGFAPEASSADEQFSLKQPPFVPLTSETLSSSDDLTQVVASTTGVLLGNVPDVFLGSSTLQDGIAISSATIPSTTYSSGIGPGSSGGGGLPSTGGVAVIYAPPTVAVVPDAASTTDAGSVPSTSSTDPVVTASSTGGIGTMNSSSTNSSTTSSAAFVLDVPTPASGTVALASFNSSTLAIDFAWQAPKNVSSSTWLYYRIFSLGKDGSDTAMIISTTSNAFSYLLSDADFSSQETFGLQAIDYDGDQSAVATTSVSLPNWLSVIQPDDNDTSQSSWYEDNWYDLGTGFHGTIRALTLEGYINDTLYGPSSVSLQEFIDPNYATLDHAYLIAPTPFTSMDAKMTVRGLKIPLLPNKYYRLTTYQQYQNRSVILKGTAATGTAMQNNFVYGTGRVESQYAFYPYLSAIIDPARLAINPPNMTGAIGITFDGTNSKIDVTWLSATDADEPFVPPTYQVNISTSTVFDPAQWQSVGTSLSTSFNVLLPHTYTVGVRAVDDFNQTSSPLIANWSFPSDYAPLAQFDHSAVVAVGSGAQMVTFPATTTVTAIDFWTAHNHTGAVWSDAETQLYIYKDESGACGAEISSGNPVVSDGGYGDGERTYQFAAPITFSSGSYWFALSIPTRFTDATVIYGSPADAYRGGSWSTSPGQDAYFRLIIASST